jgi:hypothetical protein
MRSLSDTAVSVKANQFIMSDEVVREREPAEGVTRRALLWQSVIRFFSHQPVVDQHVSSVVFIVDVLAYPFHGTCGPVLAVPLSCLVLADGPDAYLAIPKAVGVVITMWTRLGTEEHGLANEVLNCV